MINKSNKEQDNIINKYSNYNYTKLINKIVNKDLNKRLNKIYKKKKKKNIDIEVENINICDLKARLINGKKYIEQDIKCEDKCFRSFYDNITYDMTKSHFIDKNYKRLCRENSFQNLRKKMIKERKKCKIMLYKI